MCRATFAVGDLAVAIDSLANGTINHWLYEDTSGSLRERMRRAAEIFLGSVASRRAARGVRAAAGSAVAGAERSPSSPLAIPLEAARNRRRRRK